MKLSECMTDRVVTIKPDDTLRKAAEVMAATNVGMVLVGQDDRLVGAVTDRDLVIRGLSSGKNADSPVRDVMSDSVKYCFDDDDINQVAINMAAAQLRRLAVLNRSKRLVGVISVGDIARTADSKTIGDLVRNISQPAANYANQSAA